MEPWWLQCEPNQREKQHKQWYDLVALFGSVKPHNDNGELKQASHRWLWACHIASQSNILKITYLGLFYNRHAVSIAQPGCGVCYYECSKVASNHSFRGIHGAHLFSRSFKGSYIYIFFFSFFSYSRIFRDFKEVSKPCIFDTPWGKRSIWALKTELSDNPHN